MRAWPCWAQLCATWAVCSSLAGACHGCQPGAPTAQSAMPNTCHLLRWRRSRVVASRAENTISLPRTCSRGGVPVRPGRRGPPTVQREQAGSRAGHAAGGMPCGWVRSLTMLKTEAVTYSRPTESKIVAARSKQVGTNTSASARQRGRPALPPPEAPPLSFHAAVPWASARLVAVLAVLAGVPGERRPCGGGPGDWRCGRDCSSNGSVAEPSSPAASTRLIHEVRQRAAAAAGRQASMPRNMTRVLAQGFWNRWTTPLRPRACRGVGQGRKAATVLDCCNK